MTTGTDARRARARRLPIAGATRSADDPRLTPDDGAIFRDPPRADTAPLRAEIARILVRAPALPVALPVLDMMLVDVLVDRRVIDLVLGSPDPVARLRIDYPAASDSASVEVIELVPSPSHRRGLEVAAKRVGAATTRARWDEARRLADELVRAPRDVPMSFLRQLVAGVGATGIVRVGFQCNQDCGMCWQGRDWGRYDRETILTWIEDLHAAGARELIISGGEPMMDGHLTDYVAHARALGMQHVTIETNAILADRDGAAVQLRDAGLTSAFVSLHSSDPAVSDAITRAPGTHARTVRGIRAFLEVGVPVKLNAVLTAQGLDHLAELPDFIHSTFGAGASVSALMISYPSSSFDTALRATIVPEPARLREVLRATIDRAVALGIRLEGLDGPCGPPLCAFDADPRVATLAKVPSGVPFRRFTLPCETCAVRGACLGAHEAQLSSFGESSVMPLARVPEARMP
jgi:pyruvate-formate lyase-activating enzyme